MGSGYSKSSGSRALPVKYTLNDDGKIVPVSKVDLEFDNSSLVSITTFQKNVLHRMLRRLGSRVSFMPSWIRYDQLMRSIAELSQTVFGSTQQLELRMVSPAIPLDMKAGDIVKNIEAKRFDVRASLRFTNADPWSVSSPKKLEDAMWTTYVQDWRRLDSRSITTATQLKALEAVEKYLVERAEQHLKKTMSMSDEDEDEVEQEDQIIR